jgi:hypothetical protein
VKGPTSKLISFILDNASANSGFRIVRESQPGIQLGLHRNPEKDVDSLLQNALFLGVADYGCFLVGRSPPEDLQIIGVQFGPLQTSSFFHLRIIDRTLYTMTLFSIASLM